MRIALFLHIRVCFLRMLWIEPCNSPLLRSLSTKCDPYMLVGGLDIDLLPVAIPSQALPRSNVAFPQSSILYPFLENCVDELYLLAEIIGFGYALDHWVDIRALAGA